MEIGFYFQSLDFSSEDFLKGQLGSIAQLHTENSIPDLDSNETCLVIIGVQEERGAVNNQGCATGPDLIRKWFYSLYAQPYFNTPIVDLGNILEGESIDDSYHAVSAVCAYLLKRNHIPVLLGGSQDLTYANYLAYEDLEQVVNLLTVDRKFDFGENLQEQMTADTYLSHILLHQPNYLFNYANLGYQSYFVAPDTIDLMDQLHFDHARLGFLREDITRVEPLVRNVDMISVDVTAIRHSDAPGSGNSTPNGLTGEEVCRIMRYAGISDKASSIGFFEYNPFQDDSQQTAQLVAQMLWYFLDGVSSRKGDMPSDRDNNYVRYRVRVSSEKEDLLFYKSLKSDRWWLKVPFPGRKSNEYKRHQLVPCSYEDYLVACEDEVPDLWLRTYQKFL